MSGIYIHIPFCKRKCICCDFYSISFSEEKLKQYISAVKTEFNNRKYEIDLSKCNTLYIGGGTPSLLDTYYIKELVSLLKTDQMEEITIEVNPDDVSSEFAKSIKEIGINRASMGVQSFDDGELRFINRRHNSAKAIKAIECFKQAGIKNISIDLIYGIPNQTLETWSKSIDTAISLDVKHISAYSLMYEEGTLLTSKRDKGTITELLDDTVVDMYNLLVAKLETAGFDHYEISNFSLPGWHSRHNSSYWDFTPYIGLGPSAHSFDGKRRRYNPTSLKGYLSNIQNRGVAYEIEEETIKELYNEWVMTRLRTKWGLNISSMVEKFGKTFADTASLQIENFAKEGLINFDGQTAILTDKGIMMSDFIFRELFII